MIWIRVKQTKKIECKQRKGEEEQERKKERENKRKKKRCTVRKTASHFFYFYCVWIGIACSTTGGMNLAKGSALKENAFFVVTSSFNYSYVCVFCSFCLFWTVNAVNAVGTFQWKSPIHHTFVGLVDFESKLGSCELRDCCSNW